MDMLLIGIGTGGGGARQDGMPERADLMGSVDVHGREVATGILILDRPTRMAQLRGEGAGLLQALAAAAKKQPAQHTHDRTRRRTAGVKAGGDQGVTPVRTPTP
ncbi:hypothetical protein Skr01_04440 [Sphaerisporangium krabiense]|uniref:Uncharacterized protein n=1 Tax=Sphaerisporangium krabiense TaxID=763782 RepID=A0A7W8Z796_9ACTN|nr:hypothetical protein [Sphaerisporangium krabiense]MBB5628799.1 hypothetical protein [Sphaerisporangium krabiense]GII60359.1 hypothetical protein Skr01_04440 [Sphaerisporangium krabiense]